MNVAIFTDTFLPKFDGIVTSILNTAGELIRRGNRVRIFAPRIRNNQEEFIRNYNSDLDVTLIPGVRALFYPDFKITVPYTPWILRSLQRMKADVIHFHTPFTMGMEAILTSRITRTPLVSTFHTYFIEPEYLKIVKLNYVPGLVNFGWIYSNFFHNACRVTISPSKYTAGLLKQKKVRCPVKVISNGIRKQKPGNLSQEELTSIRKKYGLREKVILFIGRISVEKSIDVLLNAGKSVFEKRDDVSLLIVGNGPAFDETKKLARNLGISERVVFTGGIPHDELIKSGLFESSTVFATASTSENQPMTIIEASMFGLPLVGVDAKGVPEMIDGNGFVGEPGNAEEMADNILRILENDELRKKLSSRSLAIGKSYDISLTTDRMMETYRGVLKNRRRR